MEYVYVWHGNVTIDWIHQAKKKTKLFGKLNHCLCGLLMFG